MQTKLRFLVFAVVASLLWISPTSAVSQRAKVQGTVTKKLKTQYTGTASWYGIDRQGRKMANGQPFDRHKLTAASWYFPLGTTVRVVNVKNGESVVVTITDRGPGQHLHRLIDLSEAAAERLDYVGQGLTHVCLYPMVSVETQPALLQIPLAEPNSQNLAGTEATVSVTPM